MTTTTTRRSRSRSPRAGVGPDDPVTAYARAVVAGSVCTGRLVRCAAQRHLDDLAQGPARGLCWDAEAAQHALDFFPRLLRLAEGAHAGEPFVLQPWQQFVVGSLFGWLRVTDGFRRFRTAYVEAGKGSGKSPLGAGVLLYGLTLDGEAGAECYCAATTRDQARIAFTDAKRMAEAAPALARRLEIGEHNIAHIASGSFLRPVSSEGRGLDGKRVHMAVIDELHQHPSPDVVNKMRFWTKGRRQALILEITNAGSDRESICWQHHEMSRQVLEGTIPNDTWFAYVCQLDPCASCRAMGRMQPADDCTACDQWTDERVWAKTNPNLGVSVTTQYVREQVAEALAMPANQRWVRRYNFCVWTEGDGRRWFAPEEWTACGAAVDPAALRGRPCVLGVDLSTTTDLTAVVALFPSEDFALIRPPDAMPGVAGIADVQGHVDVLAWFFCPEAGILARASRDRVPYDLWRDQGHLIATPGAIVHYGPVRQHIRALRDQQGYDIREVAIDPSYARQFGAQLHDDDGFEVVEVPQTFKGLNEAALMIDRLVRSRQLRHGDNPPLRWCAANVVVAVDADHGWIRPDKHKSTERIDGIAALVTGATRLDAAAKTLSVYASRGMLSLGGGR